MAKDREKNPSKSITYLLPIFLLRFYLNFCLFVLIPHDNFMFKSLLIMLIFITDLNFEPEFFIVTQCIYFKWVIFYISLEIRIEMPSLSLLLMSHNHKLC